MAQHVRVYNWQSSLIGLLTITGVTSGAIAATTQGAIAQSITLDGTLGPARSLTGPTYTIPQSVGRVAGSNLFHSFGQFGLRTGETARFESDSTIRTILSRVTGPSPSTIDGLISTTSRNVNLFLINPHGIVFGPNARLNIGGVNRGSFVATTADALVWSDGGRFSAVEPGGADSLLTLVGDPSGFLAGLQAAPGSIQSTARLGVPAGQSLILLGGDVTLNGGRLTASGGRVQVGAVERGTVALNINNNALQLSVPDDSPQATIAFLNGARVSAPRIGTRANSIELNASTIQLADTNLQTANLEGGGNVILDASDRVSLTNTGINADALETGDAGTITIHATNDVGVQNSRLTATAIQSGTGGNIAIETSGNVRLTDHSSLINQTQGTGNAGNILIRGDGSVLIDSGSIATSSGALTDTRFGNAGDIDIQAGDLTLANETRLSTTTTGAGQGGNITLNTFSGPLNIANSEVRTQTTGSGNAGAIAIRSADSVDIAGLIPSSGFPGGLFSDTTGTGRAGNINSTAANIFRLSNGAVLSARTVGNGAGGTIQLTADSVDIANRGQILTRTSGSGNAGEIAIAANRNFNLTGDSILTTETRGEGNAGHISVTAGETGLIDSSSIITSSGVSTSSPAGNAGDVDIQAGTLTLTNNARLATTTTVNGQGGDITLGILNGSLNIAQSQVQTQASGAGNAGNITIHSTDSVNISGITSSGAPGGLFTNTTGSGRAGDMAIATATAFRLFDGAVLDARTTGIGAGGTIQLTANTVEIANGGQILTTTEGAGNAGNITVNAAITTRLTGNSNSRPARSTRLAAVNSAPRTGLFSSAELASTGSGGDIAVNTGRLTVTDGAQVTASSTGTGRAGGLNITARTVDLNHQARLSAETATSQAGNIQLRIGDRLVLRDRSQISAASTQTGQGGNITVNANQPAANAVRVLDHSRLSAQAEGRSRAGSVNLNARRVVVQDGAIISASTESGRGGDITLRGLDSLQVNDGQVAASTQTGQAGNVTVNAARGVRLSGRGGLSVAATQGGGAGSLTVNTNELAIANGAQATVSSPSGQAGNLTVRANTIRLDRGRLNAQTGLSQGELGANIRLRDLEQLVLRNGSRISADAGDRANGGNISIDANFIVAVPSEDSDIRANAVTGRGGNITIETEGLFGIQAAAESTPGRSDITASSERGVQGVVQINTPDVNPNQGLTELPVDVVDASQLVARSCANGAGIAAPERSEFVMTGRGGLPLSPTDSLSRDAVISPWVALNSSNTPARISDIPQPILEESSPTASLQEAQGWVISANGEVTLVTQPPVVTSGHPAFASTGCSRPPA